MKKYKYYRLADSVYRFQPTKYKALSNYRFNMQTGKWMWFHKHSFFIGEDYNIFIYNIMTPDKYEKLTPITEKEAMKYLMAVELSK